MSINLVEATDVKTGRGGRTKGEKYSKYAIAIQPSIGWIKEEIAKSPEGSIRVKTKDIAREMKGEFVNKNVSSIYWALKYCLFNEGVVVESGSHKDGDKLLIMRSANAEDVLPASLAKYLEDDEGEESVEE